MELFFISVTVLVILALMFLLRSVAHSIRSDISELQENYQELDTIKKQINATDLQEVYK